MRRKKTFFPKYVRDEINGHFEEILKLIKTEIKLLLKQRVSK